MSIESTSFHEAGHATLALLAEDVIGAPAVVTAFPHLGGQGLTLMSHAPDAGSSPAAFRAYGRMVMGGSIAEKLAGFEPLGLSGDAAVFSSLARVARRGRDFVRESADGAELLLRSHWGGVEKIAETLASVGDLVGQSGMELARLRLNEKPARTLPCSLEDLERLALSLVGIPEFAVAIRRALATLGPPLKRPAL